jgi:hypothetical protein
MTQDHFVDPDADYSIIDMNNRWKRSELAETPAEIEARLEARWMEEFRRYGLEQDAKFATLTEELDIWRELIIRSMDGNDRLIDAMGVRMMSPGEPWTDEMRELLPAITEKVQTYLMMGLDFETIMTAIKSDDTLMSCWDVLMVSMKLGGYDQAPE